MRNKDKLKLIILVIGMIFALSVMSSYSIMDDQGKNDGALENRDDPNFKRLKKSGFWSTNFIHIDGNWSHTVGNYSWCSGNGSWGNPYTIENVTIDASSSPTGSGIFIINSKNDYFIIRNCTVYNASSAYYDAGIKLQNTNNGVLTNNNCSNNGFSGIELLDYCENNTISGNIANNIGSIPADSGLAILLRNDCDNNTISGNIANNNALGGIILLINCDNNTVSENIVNNNFLSGIHLQESCFQNTISENVANGNNRWGISLTYNSDHNTVSGNTAKYNSEAGICTFVECENNTVLGNDASENTQHGIYMYYCDINFILSNIVKDNGIAGIFLEFSCDDNTLSGNTIKNNVKNGICLYDDCNDNTIEGNYIYFNMIMAINISSADCNDNLVKSNSLVSNNWKFINDEGTNTIIMSNYYGIKPPSFLVDIIAQWFSKTEFIITINVSSECVGLEVLNLSIQMWWNGIAVPSDKIAELGNDLYNVSLTPLFTNPNENPIILNMTIAAAYHSGKYFETYIAVEPPEIAKFLHVEIIEHFYSLDHFNLTFLVCDETGQTIDSATIQMWWNGVDISDDVQNLGDGFYSISLDPITVAPGEDPILLDMIISADGYEDLYYETYLAVDPIVIQKYDEGYGVPITPMWMVFLMGLLYFGMPAGLIILVIYLNKRRKRAPI